MYLFKKTPQNSAMIFLQKAEFVTPFLISHPCHFSYNSFYFFTCIGINSNFSCMREYVYLFELDSVRKTDEEIIAGQKALYSEIVNNGNIVVLTYNQLVDSRGFFSLLKDSEYQKYFIRLFENGAIRISQYGDIRSLSQYLINSVESEKQFIYSALPVKSSQRRLLSLIKRSLLYSDLSEIFEYSTGTNRSEKELIELFEELVDDETKSPENSEGTQKKRKF